MIARYSREWACPGCKAKIRREADRPIPRAAGKDRLCSVCRGTGARAEQTTATCRANTCDWPLAADSRSPYCPFHHRIYARAAEDYTESTEWTDLAVDRWGARERGPLQKRWGRGNCLKAAIASMLNARIEDVPDPTSEFGDLRGWIERYDKTLREKTGHRLERLSRSLCPPRNPNQLWIATIREDGPDDHCVVARGAFVVHDPAGTYQGSLPLDRLVDGLLLVPTQRIVPVLSPHWSGRAVVAA